MTSLQQTKQQQTTPDTETSLEGTIITARTIFTAKIETVDGSGYPCTFEVRCNEFYELFQFIDGYYWLDDDGDICLTQAKDMSEVVSIAQDLIETMVWQMQLGNSATMQSIRQSVKAQATADLVVWKATR